jgi:hypothetical protein
MPVKPFSTRRRQTTHDFIVGDNETVELIRSKDWSRTPLGPIEAWPQVLKTTVTLCLASPFPINIIWGRDHTQVYNDAYRIICGDAHPTALGQSYRATWVSAWPVVGEPFERALNGETSYLENQGMFLTRNGYLEETFFTFSLSPIRGADGAIGGLFLPVTETTATLLADRRTRTLRDLTYSLSAASTMSAERGPDLLRPDRQTGIARRGDRRRSNENPGRFSLADRGGPTSERPGIDSEYPGAAR